VASLANYGAANRAQASAGNVVYFGELADDGVLLGDDASQGIELGLDDGKIILEARDLVRGVVQGLGDVCLGSRVCTPGQRDERDNREKRKPWHWKEGQRDRLVEPAFEAHLTAQNGYAR
jgi:hypothetical protein